MNDQERVAFEAWGQAEGLEAKNDDRGMEYPLGDMLWRAWQARAAQAPRELSDADAYPWNDADSDAARLALELECLLLSITDASVVARWWDSANEALAMHRNRLAAAAAKGE